MARTTYTVGQLARLAGVSVRTIRHYDEKGLLVPTRRENGYRSYDDADVERLQQILLFRACGMSVSDIRTLLEDPSYDPLVALESQLETLRQRQEEIDQLIATTSKTISNLKGETTMTNTERFEGLRRTAIDENEKRYGAEARARHGDAAVDAANEHLNTLSEQEWNDMNALESAIIDQLAAAMKTGDPTSTEAAKLASMHARWIQQHWGPGAYTPEAHRQLAQGYLADKRFRAYYDSRAGDGATDFLAAAITRNV